MDNKSQEVSWLDRGIKRFHDLGIVIPDGQRKLYEKIRDHWAQGRLVMDVGCSIGVGSNILSHSARHVWGVDMNEEAVKFADQVFARPNLSFDIYDIEKSSTRELAKFEIVVVSEVIEHLTDPTIGLSVIKKFFKPDTIGFITAPNINNEDVKKRDSDNELHLQHWTAGEFYSLMIQNFASVTLYSVEKLNQWNQEETIDGDSTDGLIIAKVEGAK